MAVNSFFEQRKPWSERKHRLLGKYLAPFSAKVATATANRGIFVIDGFAGAAIYDDGSSGSPMLIAQFGDVCRSWKNPVSLKLVNVEQDEDAFAQLEAATKPWVEAGKVINLKKDFRSAMPDILRIVGTAPALFFLDPFGPTAIHFADLRPILSRDQKITELIINFDQDGLRRIVDAAFSTNTDPKTAQTNAANVSAIIGSDAWRSKIEGLGLTSNESETVLLHEYMNSLSALRFDVVAYPIREELTSKPKYYFVYCTRHTDGLALMNDFIREEEDMLYGEHVSDNLPLFLDEASLARAVETRRALLRDQIRQFLEKDKGPVTRRGIRDHLTNAKFGVFHTKDYNAVVRQLISDGECWTETGKTRINDDDFLYHR